MLNPMSEKKLEEIRLFVNANRKSSRKEFRYLTQCFDEVCRLKGEPLPEEPDPAQGTLFSETLPKVNTE